MSFTEGIVWPQASQMCCDSISDQVSSIDDVKESSYDAPEKYVSNDVTFEKEGNLPEQVSSSDDVEVSFYGSPENYDAWNDVTFGREDNLPVQVSSSDDAIQDLEGEYSVSLNNELPPSGSYDKVHGLTAGKIESASDQISLESDFPKLDSKKQEVDFLPTDDNDLVDDSQQIYDLPEYENSMEEAENVLGGTEQYWNDESSLQMDTRPVMISEKLKFWQQMNGKAVKMNYPRIMLKFLRILIKNKSLQSHHNQWKLKYLTVSSLQTTLHLIKMKETWKRATIVLLMN